jgi:CubicO group peptidase (beta-lactamase class C family)
VRQVISVASLLATVLTALTFSLGCQPQQDVIACDSLGCISEKNFGNKIVSTLKASPGVVGYVVNIGAYPPNFGGNAVLSPASAMLPNDLTNVASVSKMLTTFAVLKSLSNHNISLDSSIFPYLYTDWQNVANPSINEITFRDLLTHRSGFPSNTASSGCNGPKTGYAILKSYIESNYSPLPAGAQGVYSNCNFAIFRELLPQMEGDSIINVTPDNIFGANLRAQESANFYINYVNQNVLAAGGVYGLRNCAPTSNYAYRVLSYPTPPATSPSTDWGDYTLTCGGGGWNVSAADLTSVFNSLAAGSLLTPAQQAQLYSGSGSNYPGLGWNNTIGNCPGANQNGQTYYWCKPGDLDTGSNPDVGIETFAGMFKCNSVPVVVIVNSLLSQDITAVVTTAFNDPSTQASGSPKACSTSRGG